MRKHLATWLPLLALLALTSAPALAGADRFVFEDGTTGANTTGFSSATSGYVVVYANGASTTLVAQTCAANACTRAAPSGATEGMSLADIGSYQVWACLSTGTFTGTGAIKLSTYNDNGKSGAQWAYASGKDMAPSNGDSGCVVWQERNSFGAAGTRLVARAVSVGTSTAAPTLEVRIFGCLRGAGCFLADARARPRERLLARATIRADPRWDAVPAPDRRRLFGALA